MTTIKSLIHSGHYIYSLLIVGFDHSCKLHVALCNQLCPQPLPWQNNLVGPGAISTGMKWLLLGLLASAGASISYTYYGSREGPVAGCSEEGNLEAPTVKSCWLRSYDEDGCTSIRLIPASRQIKYCISKTGAVLHRLANGTVQRVGAFASGLPFESDAVREALLFERQRSADLESCLEAMSFLMTIEMPISRATLAKKCAEIDVLACRFDASSSKEMGMADASGESSVVEGPDEDTTVDEVAVLEDSWHCTHDDPGSLKHPYYDATSILSDLDVSALTWLETEMVEADDHNTEPSPPWLLDQVKLVRESFPNADLDFEGPLWSKAMALLRVQEDELDELANELVIGSSSLGIGGQTISDQPPPSPLSHESNVSPSHRASTQTQCGAKQAGSGGSKIFLAGDCVTLIKRRKTKLLGPFIVVFQLAMIDAYALWHLSNGSKPIIVGGEHLDHCTAEEKRLLELFRINPAMKLLERGDCVNIVRKEGPSWDRQNFLEVSSGNPYVIRGLNRHGKYYLVSKQLQKAVVRSREALRPVEVADNYALESPTNPSQLIVASSVPTTTPDPQHFPMGPDSFQNATDASSTSIFYLQPFPEQNQPCKRIFHAGDCVVASARWSAKMDRFGPFLVESHDSSRKIYTIRYPGDDSDHVVKAKNLKRCSRGQLNLLKLYHSNPSLEMLKRGDCVRISDPCPLMLSGERQYTIVGLEDDGRYRLSTPDEEAYYYRHRELLKVISVGQKRELDNVTSEQRSKSRKIE